MITIEDDKDTKTFREFERAVTYCQRTYGYSGKVWDSLKESYDFNELCDFLLMEGIWAETY